ncbi:hypothetical protein Golob_001367, partial [Gossypium lobatum]|nr:hypothetical protein [Gossypium lobatum]
MPTRRHLLRHISSLLMKRLGALFLEE